MLSRSKTCSYCLKEYEDNSLKNSMKYCSVVCRRKSKVIRVAQKQGKKVPSFLDEQQYTCEWCTEKFIPKDITQLFCSLECREQKYHDDKYKDVPSHLESKIKCLECGEEFTGCIPHGGRSGNHFQSHNLTTQEYLEKYPEASIYSKAARWKMSQAERTFPEDFSDTCKKAQLRRYENDVIWNLGKTLDTEEGLMRISQKARERFDKGFKNGFSDKKHSDEQKAQWSVDRKIQKLDSVYAENWMASVQRAAKRGAYVSEPHAVVVQGMRESGLWDGFEIEKWLTVGGITHGIDICGPYIAIEIDGCYYHDCPIHESHIDAPKQRERDRMIDAAYTKAGWKVLRFWEHEVKEDLQGCLKRIGILVGKTVEFDKGYKDVASNLDIDLQAMLAKFQIITDLSSFDDQQVLDYYKERGFPYPRYSSKTLKEDFKALCRIDVSRVIEVQDGVLTQKRMGIGMKAPNMFSSHFWDAKRKGKRSAVEVFHGASFISVIQSRRKHTNRISDATIRTGLKIHASSPSSFPSLVAKYIYGTFLTGHSRVLDPCIGYGGRMVGSQSLPYDVDYIGYDPWEEACGNVNDMRKWFQWEHCEIHNRTFEDATLVGMFDLAFTSPPHFDKEVYSDQQSQSICRYPEYPKWLFGFIRPLVKKSCDHLKDGGHLVLHFSDEIMSNDVLSVMQENGLNTRVLKWKQSSFLSGTRFEYFLIGQKRA